MTNIPASDLICFCCSKCGTTLSALPQQAGTTFACPVCQAPQTVPTPLLPPAPQPAPVPAAVAYTRAAPEQHANLEMPAETTLETQPEAAPAYYAEPAPAPSSAIPAAVEMQPPAQESAPSAQVVQTETAPAYLAAQSMDIAADPASVQPEAAAEDATAAAPPRMPRMPYRSPFAKPAPKPPKSSRGVVVGASACVVLVVLGFVGVSIRNGMERHRIEDEIQATLSNAEVALSEADINAAYEKAIAAERGIKNSTQPLTQEKMERWEQQIKRFNDLKSEVDQLESTFAAAEKDPRSTRTRLEARKSLYAAANPDNTALRGKVDALLTRLTALELQRKKKTVADEMAAAEKLYTDGKIEDAGARATALSGFIAEKPPLMDAEVERRIVVLQKRAADLESAKSERMKARGDSYADAKQKLQRRIGALDEANADLKPLVARLNDLKRELEAEEKRSRKLPPAEAETLQRIAIMLASVEKTVSVGKLDGDTIGLTLDGKPVRLGLSRTALSKSYFLEVGANRFLIDIADIVGRRPQGETPGKHARPLRVLTHALALGEAMQKAGVLSDELWDARDEAPLVSARRAGADGVEYIFLGDRLYTGKTASKTSGEKEVEADFAKKAEALEKAVESDKESDEDVRRVVAVAIHAAYKKADWNDHLPGEFVRQVIAEGYAESNLPGIDKRLKKELADYREAYDKISNVHPRFNGTTPAGDEAEEMRTYEDHSVWRIYDKAADLTTFAIKNPDDEKDCLFVLNDFPGKLAAFPADPKPKTIRMTHQAVGVTATCDMATEKLTFDRAVWDKAVRMEISNIDDAYRTRKGFGPPVWHLPPHVLILTLLADSRSLITPYGRVDITDFSKIAEGPQRVAAMEKFLDQLAKVLPTPDYMHLYFRYFFEYALDSPITSHPFLLGSRAHSGDIHQTTYESLMRLMAGRYFGDCDDLAEFFMNLTRRQGKLSYVMGLPQHAACGWVEHPTKEDPYRFFVLDTGPPRQFTNKSLDGVIEAAFRAYDDENTMRFDPKSLQFLFRFNGEPTRTPYYLSSRMYVDREYGEAMERVQSYWHFHFYALGIETMTKMIEKGDRVPENCTELAGLYGWVHEVEDSIKWTNEAIKQLAPDERLSRMSEQFRIALMWREVHNNEKSYDALKGLRTELKELLTDPQSIKYLSMRMQVANLLTTVDKPWEAWDLLQPEMEMFAEKGAFKIDHAGGLTTTYKKMQDLIHDGKKPNDAEVTSLKRLERLLTWFYSTTLFEADDDFNDFMRKYASLGLFYAGKYGQQRFVDELLKPGPFPDPAVKRNHMRRKDGEEEDWKWIRLALPSYSMAIGEALDMDDPPEKWRREEAVKLTDAMLKAAEHARQFGSLSSAEYGMIASRLFGDFLAKPPRWTDVDDVFKLAQTRNWARLTTDVAETLGRSARFVTPQEFVAQYRVFTKYIKSRPSYFTVVYEAYKVDAYEHALAAAKVAIECNPGDEDMKREAKYLEQLIKKKLESKPATPPKTTK